MDKLLPAFIASAILVMSPLKATPLPAQEQRPLIKINPITAPGLGPEESYLIESLIRSCLSDLGEVVSNNDLPFDRDAFAGSSGGFSLENPFGTANFPVRSPDYIISGTIYLDQDNRIFTMEITKTATRETTSTTTIHRTIGDLALKTRSLVEAIFSPEREEEKQREAQREPLTEQGISGSWRGEPGFEMIRFYRGGTGIAILSSGAQMTLSYTIQGAALQVSQNSPNMERFYHPLPYPIARKLAETAEPMRWELFLHEKGTVLRGKKTLTGVRYEGDELLELLPGLTREVEWVRIH